MDKRFVLLVAPLVVVAIAAGVAVAATPDGEPSGATLDKLHAVRPIAASPAAQIFASLGDGLQRSAAAIQAFAKRQALQHYLDTLRPGEPSAALPDQTAPAPASAPPTTGSTPGGFLACVRQRESGGDYQVHNLGGSGASGAYQIMPGTWDSIAQGAGRRDLVGVDPANASPADQDSMAAALYAQQGAAPWGGGC